MTCALPNSKILTPTIKCQGQWIHLIGGSGGNEPSGKQLGGFEQYLPGDDFALGPTTREKSGAQKGNG